MYGEERFHAELFALRDRSMAGLIDGVIDAIMRFGNHQHPQDDITLLGVGIQGGFPMKNP